MKTILVCLDGSKRAPGVLAESLNVACAHGARLVLLRSMGLPVDLPQDIYKITDEPLADLMRRHAVAYLEEELARVPLELRATNPIEVHVGVPWDAICKAAGDRKADLVIVGSHGYSGLDRLLGTTAAKVVNHAPCSVLVIRDPAAARDEHHAS